MTQANEGAQTGLLRVAVLMGGSSSERPVSLATGKQIVQALDKTRYCVTAVDTEDLLTLALPDLTQHRVIASLGSSALTADVVENSQTVTAPAHKEMKAGFAGRADLVFVALHGKGGEDGTIQGFLEFLGLPYTGSGVLASALAMNKSVTKRLLAAEGIPVIPAVTVMRQERFCEAHRIRLEVAEKLGYPVFVKPNSEGSTFGCTLVHGEDQLEDALDAALGLDELALVERYVKGTEITVGVLDGPGGAEALPIVEIVPRSAYYDYESKYADGGSEHIIPARLGSHLADSARRAALECHRILGCSGMSRTDIIVEGESLYVLEVNTIPGMTPTSLLPQAAEHAGISFSKLLDRIIESALRST